MTKLEAKLGGPGLDGYAYNADVYCVDCGLEIIDALAFPMDDDTAGDTDSCPQPIFFGEHECAQYCGNCGEFLYGGGK